MTKLSFESPGDQPNDGIDLETLNDSDIVSVLRARNVSYGAELLSLNDRTKYVTGLRDANAKLLARYIGTDLHPVGEPKIELRGAGTLAQVLGEVESERVIRGDEEVRAQNLRAAQEKRGPRRIRERR